MKDIHIELSDLLNAFRNLYWQEAQCILHESTMNLTGREIACLAIQRASARFIPSCILDEQTVKYLHDGVIDD